MGESEAFGLRESCGDRGLGLQSYGCILRE